MVNVNWWSWKCARCGFETKSQLTVNPQQAVAEAIMRVHLREHEQQDQAAAASPQEREP